MQPGVLWHGMTIGAAGELAWTVDLASLVALDPITAFSADRQSHAGYARGLRHARVA